MKAVANRPAPKVQRKAAVPRKQQRDGHEIQAEQAARAFVRGGKGLGQWLTPAPPAGFNLSGSRGEALPTALRFALETAFDADLAAVRVHRDMPAIGAASDFGAHAFASGTNIYFGAGRFDAASETGRELVAHEVAHVLQQTGRASSGGRLRSEPAAPSEGRVQCSPDPNDQTREARKKLIVGTGIGDTFETADLLQPSTDTLTCIEVVERHSGLGNDALVQGYAAKIKQSVDGKSVDDAVNAVDEVLAKVSLDDKTAAVKALFFDAYKALNADKNAVGVVGKLLPEQTAFGSWSFYEAHRRGDASWVTKLLKAHPVARKYYPNAIVAVARIDFYGVTRGGLDLDPNMKFRETMGDAIVEALLYQPLMPDERTAVALRAFCAFDAVRLMPFASLATALKGKNSLLSRFHLKQWLISKYTDPQFLPKQAQGVGSEPEVLQIATEAGELIAPVAERAERYWKSITTLLEATVARDKTDLSAKEQSEKLQATLRKRLPALKPLAGTEKRLTAILVRAMKMERGGIPRPVNMAANFVAAGKMVDQLIYHLDGALAARDKKLQVNDVSAAAQGPDVKGSDTKEDQVTDDMVYGLVLVLMFVLQHQLVSYAAPPKTGDEAQRLKNQDAALEYFLQMANVFVKLGNSLGYRELSAAADEVARAEQAGLSKSYVGLLVPFEPVPATLKDFSNDFPTGEVSGGALKGASLVQMAYALYYENLLGKLNDALGAPGEGGKTREFDYTGKEPVVNIALKAVEADVHLPRKYRVPVESTILYIRPADWKKVSDFLPGKHPIFQALISEYLGADELYATPKNIDAHAEGFVVWLLPDMGRLVEKLAQVPGLDRLKRPDGKPLGVPKDYPATTDWLLALNQAAASDEKLREDLADAINDWMTTARGKLDAPLRRATNNERNTVRPLIEAQWELLTKSFLESPKTFYEAPRRALELTLIFAGNVQPATATEQMLQMTGLMLELAPVLSRKLGESTTFGSLVTISGTSRLDIVLPLYAHVNGAAKLAADSVKAAELGSLNLAFPVSELERRTEQLKKLAQEFRATAESAHEDTALEGLPNENVLRVPDRGYAVVGKTNPTDEVDDSFMVGGIVYTLVKVHRAFRYQPEHIAYSSIVPWTEDDFGKRRLWVDGKPVPVDAAEIPLVTIMRTTSGGQPAEIVVTSNNVAMLSELTYALHMHVVLKGLEELAGVLEGFAGVITTALQIAFPEFAPEIAYAEIAGTVIQFLGSPEYAALKGALDSDSGSLFDKGLSKIKDQLTLDALWDYLLFDNEPPLFTDLRLAMDLIGRMNLFKNKGDDKTKSAFRKVFGRLMKVGAELVHGAEVVHEHVDFPVRQVALFVEGSPWVSLLLRAVSRNIYRLQGMSLAELGIEQAADMVGEVQQMYLRFEKIIDGLANFELPEELVPLEAIIEMVVNFIIDRLPIKYRLPLKESRHISAVEEIFQWLFGKAADQLREAHIDPNIIWRDLARGAINPYLQKAGREVSDEAHGLLNQVPFLHNLATINVGDVAMQFISGDVQPVQPKLMAGSSVPRGAAHLPAGQGTSLNPSVQQQARRGWGHDFSHVRIHRDDDVDSGLRNVGALAATSGSHVYLDSRLNTSSPEGRDVLNHELAHVLQQTGPRPLGARYSSRPIRGEAGSGTGGWRLDAASEAQADRLAQSAREPARMPRSVMYSYGMQPKLTDTIAKFFQKLGDPSKLQENADEMLNRSVNEAAMKQAVPQLKDSFANKLIGALKTVGQAGSAVSFTSPFDLVGKDLVDYVANNRKEDLEKGIPHVLMTGLQEIQPKKGKGTSTASIGKFWIVNPGRVETALEEFFFGETGVSVDVEFNTRKEPGPDGKERKTIDPDHPFAKLKFNYVHLPMIGGGADLWKGIMTNSFPKAGDKLALYQTKARLALQGLQPSPGIFTGATVNGAKVLVFSKRIKELIETYVNPGPNRKLPGDVAPLWADYIKPDPQPRVKLGKDDYGQIGLRLGRYKDKTNPDQQKGSDRASHHTVQYLLLEYLVNSKDRVKPFPNSLALYPNIRGSGERVDVIARTPDEKDGIKVSTNEKDRGGEMPTILLSVHAHILGDVHITPKADDLDTVPPSQGSAIHGVFKDSLGDFSRIVLGKPEPLQALINQRAGKPYKQADIPMAGGQVVTSESLSTAIFSAACKTYTWMRDHMNDKLALAIDSREKEYYEALVKSAQSPIIYANGQPQTGYFAEKVGTSIMAEVKKKQVASMESASFGFEEMK